MSEEPPQIHNDLQKSSDRKPPTTEELRRELSHAELARVFDTYQPIDLTVYKEGTVGCEYIGKEFKALNGRLRPQGIMEIPLEKVKSVISDRRTRRVLGDSSVEKLLKFGVHNLHEISLMGVPEFEANTKFGGVLIKAKPAYLAAIQDILCGPEGLLFANLPVRSVSNEASGLPAQPVSNVAEVARRDALKKVVLNEILPAQDCQLLFDRFGLRDGVVRTEVELAKLYGLTDKVVGSKLYSSYRLLGDHADLQPFMFTQGAHSGPTCLYDSDRGLTWNDSAIYSQSSFL
jgi:hypothetical protein